MFTKPFLVNGPWAGRLNVSPRPRGGDWLEDELKAWREAGVDVVVSLLECEEVSEKSLVREEQLANASGMEFRSFPIVDRGVPRSLPELQELIDDLSSKLKDGRTVVVHCRQGIGRAGLVAICLLLRGGLPLMEAVREVSSARGLSVPETEEQLGWLRAHERVI